MMYFIYESSTCAIPGYCHQYIISNVTSCCNSNSLFCSSPIRAKSFEQAVIQVCPSIGALLSDIFWRANKIESTVFSVMLFFFIFGIPYWLTVFVYSNFSIIDVVWKRIVLSIVWLSVDFTIVFVNHITHEPHPTHRQHPQAHESR